MRTSNVAGQYIEVADSKTAVARSPTRQALIGLLSHIGLQLSYSDLFVVQPPAAAADTPLAEGWTTGRGATAQLKPNAAYWADQGRSQRGNQASM